MLDPRNWTPEEAQRACQQFMAVWDDETQTMDVQLVVRLWRYWFFVHGQTPLMESPQHNIALMLSAQAYGEFVPPSGTLEFFSKYRLEHSINEQSLMPERLTWGPRATLSPVAYPNLDSAILHAYVFKNLREITEVLIIGQAPQEIQREIFQSAFSCSLRVQSSDQDMLKVDVLRVVSPGNRQELLDLPGITVLGTSPVLKANEDETASGILQSFVRQLYDLASRTGLLVVHECNVQPKQDFDRSIRVFARDASEKGQITVLARNGVHGPEVEHLAIPIPYYSLTRRPFPLSVVVDPYIVDSDKSREFQELFNAFKFRLVNRLIADAEVRLENYEKRAEYLKEELSRWRSASDQIRRELWDQTVRLTEKFDIEAGVIIRLPAPIEISTEEYFARNVPIQISGFESWSKRMQQIIEQFNSATIRPDTPIRRLAINYFIDAALRDKGDLLIDKQLTPYFERWKQQVVPLLRHRWRSALLARGIDPQSIFNRHTVFQTYLRINEQGGVDGLIIQGLNIVVPAHMVIVFDPSKPLLQFHAPMDYAEKFQSETNINPDRLRQEVEQHLREPHQLVEKVRDALLQAPQSLLPILASLLATTNQENSELKHRELDLQKEYARLGLELRQVTFPSKLIHLLNYGACHSARELIKETTVPNYLKVRMPLWLILVECRAAFQDPSHVINALSQSTQSYFDDPVQPELASLVEQLLKQANSLDSSYVQKWLKYLHKDKGYSQAVILLARDWIQLENTSSSPDRLALHSLAAAIESSVLARHLESAASTINPYGESTGTLLTKVGRSLEAMLLSDAGRPPTSDLLNLLEKLTGEQH